MKYLIIAAAVFACASCAGLTVDQQKSIAEGTGTAVGALATAATGGNPAIGMTIGTLVTTGVNWLISKKLG